MVHFCTLSVMSLLSFGDKGQISFFTFVENEQEILASFTFSKENLKMWSKVKKKGVLCISEVLGQPTSSKYSRQTLLRITQN